MKSNKKFSKIYLDNAAATPLASSVLSRMSKILKNNFANPSAIHNLGVKDKKLLEEARKEIAQVFGTHYDEIIITSGATESNNFALRGIIKIWEPSSQKGARLPKKPHIMTTSIEHPSVLEVCKYLEETKQAEVTYVPVEKNGIVDPKKIKKAIKPNTALVSVMYANNEIGTIQPIQEIAKEIRHYNKNHSKKVLFHTDGTQGVNYLPIKVEKLGIDLMSFNGGKIYGPKGIGGLYIKRKTSIEKIIYGGAQEMSFRPGTENLAGIVGLAEALKVVEKIKEKESKRLIKLRDYFIKKLLDLDFGITVNGDLEKRLPNNVNITIPGIPGDLLVLELSARGIYVSERSACKASQRSGLCQLEAKRNKETIKGRLRFSLGRQTTKADLDYTLKAFSEILAKLKKWYN